MCCKPSTGCRLTLWHLNQIHITGHQDQGRKQAAAAVLFLLAQRQRRRSINICLPQGHQWCLGCEHGYTSVKILQAYAWHWHSICAAFKIPLSLIMQSSCNYQPDFSCYVLSLKVYITKCSSSLDTTATRPGFLLSRKWHNRNNARSVCNIILSVHLLSFSLTLLKAMLQIKTWLMTKDGTITC